MLTSVAKIRWLEGVPTSMTQVCGQNSMTLVEYRLTIKPDTLAILEVHIIGFWWHEGHKRDEASPEGNIRGR
jgi:hypothetical protein